MDNIKEQLIKEATEKAAPSAREAALQSLAGQDFASKLTSAWSEENTKLKSTSPNAGDFKIPKPDPTLEKDYDPSKHPVDDPKGILEQKQEAPKVEAKPEPKADDYPENAKSTEAKSSWDKLKQAKAEIEKKLQEKETEILELKKQFDPDAYKKAVDEAEKLSLEVRKLAVERHPKFKETFEKPLNEAIDRAKKSIPQNYHADAEKWLKAPDSPERDQAIQEITAALPPHKAASFVRYVEDAQLAIERRNEALSQEKQWATKWEADQRAAEEKARMQTEAAAKSTFQNVLRDKFSSNPLFQGEEAASRVQFAEKLLFGENPPEQIAEAALWAAYGRELAPLLDRSRQEIAALQAQIDKLSGKSLGKDSGNSQTTSSGPSSMMEAIAAEWNKLKGA